MERTENGYRLSSGRTFYANDGLLSLGQDDIETLREGYDAIVYVAYDGDHENDSPLTPEERAEIADFMIAQWQRYKAFTVPHETRKAGK